MKIFGQHDEQTVTQFEKVREHAVDAALMADGHVGYVMPIGGVAAYDNQVSVVGVGFDIACGNAAIRTDMTLYDLDSEFDREQIASDIQRSISFGVGRTNNHDDPTLKEHALFDNPAWDALPKSG